MAMPPARTRSAGETRGDRESSLVREDRSTHGAQASVPAGAANTFRKPDADRIRLPKASRSERKSGRLFSASGAISGSPTARPVAGFTMRDISFS